MVLPCHVPPITVPSSLFADTERLVKVDVAVVEVALKSGALIVLYAVKSPVKIPLPPKRELPTTSKILPVVVVAFEPITNTSLVSTG